MSHSPCSSQDMALLRVYLKAIKSDKTGEQKTELTISWGGNHKNQETYRAPDVNHGSPKSQLANHRLVYYLQVPSNANIFKSLFSILLHSIIPLTNLLKPLIFSTSIKSNNLLYEEWFFSFYFAALVHPKWSTMCHKFIEETDTLTMKDRKKGKTEDCHILASRWTQATLLPWPPQPNRAETTAWSLTILSRGFCCKEQRC